MTDPHHEGTHSSFADQVCAQDRKTIRRVLAHRLSELGASEMAFPDFVELLDVLCEQHDFCHKHALVPIYDLHMLNADPEDGRPTPTLASLEVQFIPVADFERYSTTADEIRASVMADLFKALGKQN